MNVLPHAVNTFKLKHFEEVKIPIISQSKRIDILLGQTYKELLTVLEKRESLNASDPHYFLMQLRRIATGGCVEIE